MGPGKFLLVRCIQCKNEQTIYNKCASMVTCIACGALLAEPRGGKAVIRTKIIKPLANETGEKD